MFTTSEMIIGLWFVPVVLCILVPLAMLCVWAVIQLPQKKERKTAQLDTSAKKVKDESFVENLQSHPAT